MANQPKGTVWTERALVAMILASLAGALFLTISVYRRALNAHAPSPPRLPAVVATIEPEPAPEPEPEPEPAPTIAAAPEPAEPPPPQEDPTAKALAELAEATARETAEASRLDQRLRELDAAKRAATAESDRWRRRDMLVQRQITEMTQRAETIDRQADQYAAQRDVLASVRDTLKAAHARAQGRGSYAVLPYKGENGTWRRPIVLECVNGTVTLRPNGPTFSMLDLSGLVSPRSSPVIVAIARELLKVQQSESPDGSPVVPYFVFLVRPDGIRPYYEARARLEPLGIAFGYELIDQNLQVDVPDFDDLATWDGSPGGPPPSPVNIATGAVDGAGNGGGGLAWPGAPKGTGTSNRGPDAGALAGAFNPSGRSGDGQGTGNAGDSPDDFIWSGASGGRGAGGGGGGDGGLFPGGGNATGSAPPADRRSPGTGLAGALYGLPDFEPAGDGTGTGSGNGTWTGAGAEPGVGGGRSAPVATGGANLGGGGLAPSNRSAGLGAGLGGTAIDPKGAGGSARPPAGPGGGDPNNGGLAETGGGRSLTGSTGLANLEPAPGGGGPAGASAGGSDKPVAAGLMWGDGPASASGSSPGAAGSSPSPSSSTVAGASGGASPAAGTGTGSGSGPRPLISLGQDGKRASGSPGGGPPPSGLGLGMGALDELAGLLGGAAGGGSGSSGGGTGASGGGSGLMIGSDANSSSSSSADPAQPVDELDAALAKQRRGSSGPASVIEVPFEIVVVCDAEGATIQPGGYRITADALRDQRGERLLVRNLVAAVRQRALVDPNIRPRPRVKFLVERDGGTTFWEARKQVLFADLNWPMTLQVAGGGSPRLFDREAWR